MAVVGGNKRGRARLLAGSRAIWLATVKSTMLDQTDCLSDPAGLALRCSIHTSTKHFIVSRDSIIFHQWLLLPMMPLHCREASWYLAVFVFIIFSSLLKMRTCWNSNTQCFCQFETIRSQSTHHAFFGFLNCIWIAYFPPSALLILLHWTYGLTQFVGITH